MKTPEEQFDYYMSKAELAHKRMIEHGALSAKAAEEGDYVTSIYEHKISVWMLSQEEKWRDNADQLANAMK